MFVYLDCFEFFDLLLSPPPDVARCRTFPLPTTPCCVVEPFPVDPSVVGLPLRVRCRLRTPAPHGLSPVQSPGVAAAATGDGDLGAGWRGAGAGVKRTWTNWRAAAVSAMTTSRPVRRQSGSPEIVFKARRTSSPSFGGDWRLRRRRRRRSTAMTVVASRSPVV